jgi:flagellar FliL protein
MSEEEKDKTATADGGEGKKKKGSRKLLVLLTLTIVLGTGIGGGAFWWMKRGAGNAAGAAGGHGQAEKPPESSGVVPLEQFTINLADTDASRFLRVTVNLVINDEKHANEVKETPLALLRLRSAVLEVLTQQTSDKVTTPEGKDELKKTIIARTSPVLAPSKVIDVLFSDFVVQF